MAADDGDASETAEATAATTATDSSSPSSSSSSSSPATTETTERSEADRCLQPLLHHQHADFVRVVSFDHERIVTVCDDGAVQILCFTGARAT